MYLKITIKIECILKLLTIFEDKQEQQAKRCSEAEEEVTGVCSHVICDVTVGMFSCD